MRRGWPPFVIPDIKKVGRWEGSLSFVGNPPPLLLSSFRPPFESYVLPPASPLYIPTAGASPCYCSCEGPCGIRFRGAYFTGLRLDLVAPGFCSPCVILAHAGTYAAGVDGWACRQVERIRVARSTGDVVCCACVWRVGAVVDGRIGDAASRPSRG